VVLPSPTAVHTCKCNEYDSSYKETKIFRVQMVAVLMAELLILDHKTHRSKYDRKRKDEVCIAPRDIYGQEREHRTEKSNEGTVQIWKL
jgi:hypothetical protein